MKALRSPWVSGALALIAAGVVLYQLLQPRWAQARVAMPAAPAPVAALPQTSLPLPAQPAATNAAALPALCVDRAYAESHLAEWADSPRRDPFLLIPVALGQPVHQYPSPVLRWKLKGIWRQTGGRVAAINSRVYSEGDIIEGFRIEKIDDDQVWIQGPDRMERLSFDQTDPGRAGSPPAARLGKPPGGAPAPRS